MTTSDDDGCNGDIRAPFLRPVRLDNPALDRGDQRGKFLAGRGLHPPERPALQDASVAPGVATGVHSQAPRS